jgi:4-amino-4-deoxy-L-arabinose transferase-like glycosyltransferase
MRTTQQTTGPSWWRPAHNASPWLRGDLGSVCGAAGALSLGLVAQRLLDARTAPAAAALCYGLAMLIFAGSQPASTDEAPAAAALPAPEPGRLAVYLALALGLAAAAFGLLGGNRFRPLGTGLWLASIAVLVAASLPAGARAWLAGRPMGSRDADEGAPGGRSRDAWLGVGVALAAGAFLRLYLLSEIPAEMGTDVPHVYNNIRTILDGEYPIFFPSHPGREGLFFYLAAPLARLFGLSHTTIKLASALVGLACLPIVYLLGAELFGRRAGVCAALLLSISHWHVICSRSGLRAGTELPLMMLAWLWLARGLRRGRRWEFLLAGLALGLGMHTYNAFAAVPLAMAVLLVAEELLRRGAGLRANRANLILWAVAALVAFTPLARYAWDEPRMYVYRAATRVTGLEKALPADLLRVALGNAWRALLMFHYQGDAVYTTNVPFLRELGYLTAVLAALGGALVARRWRSGYNLTVLTTLGIGLLPTALSLAFPQEVPNAFRALGALPPAMLLAGAGLGALWERTAAALQLGQRAVAEGRQGWGGLPAYMLGALLGLGLLGGLAAEARATGYTVFQDFRLSQPRHNYPLSREMARVIDDYAEGEAYSVAWPHWYDGNAVRAQLSRDAAGWHDVPALAPGQPPLSVERALVIVHPSDSATQRLLREAFPGGVFVQHRDWDGYIVFLAFYGAR